MGSPPSSARGGGLLALCWGVVACWAVALFFGATRGLDLLKNCKWDLSSPKGSPSDRAAQLAGEYLLQKGGQYELSQAALVTALSPATHPVTHLTVRQLMQRLLAATVGNCDGGVSTNMSLSARHRRASGVPTCWWRNMHGIFVPDGNALAPHRALGTHRLFEDRDLDVWSDLVSPDNRTATLVLWDINSGFGADGNKWETEAWKRLGDTIDTWLLERAASSGESGAVGTATNGDLYEVGFTHLQMLLAAGQKGVPQDIEHGDMITLPIAWIILLYSCGPSACLVLITLPVTLLVTFWLLNGVATGALLGNHDGSAAVEFPSFTPAIFINMIIAISLDYGLFMLTRYGEELRRGMANADAVRVALSRAGRVVFVSGVTLGLTNAGLTFCSVDVVASIGWGGTMACFVAVAVHLTLLPALMVIAGPCLRPAAHYRCSCAALTDRICGGGGGGDGSGTSLSTPLRTRGPGRSTKMSRSGSEEIGPRWVQLGEFCRDHRNGIVAVMVAMLLPCCYAVLQYQTSISGLMLTPRQTPALVAMENITTQGINAGVLNPIVILVYNPGSAAAGVAPLALEPRCHDDDTDLRLLLDGMGLTIGKIAVSSLPAASVTCTELKTITEGEICTAENVSGVPTRLLAQAFCPGSCTNLCDAAGFGTDTARANRNRTVLAPEIFTLVGELRRKLLSAFPDLPRHAIRDITTEPFTNQAVPDVPAAFQLLQGPGVKPRSTPYQARFQRLTSYNHSATLIEVLLPHPQGVGGSEDVQKIRALLAEPPWKDSGYGFLVLGSTASLLDSVSLVFVESPPILIGVAFTVVFVVAGLAFRSLLIPLRLLGTVVATLAITAGSTVVLFLHVLELDGIYWFVPICAASLVVGLTVDYDVFLISRVYEHRLEGFTTEASILRAIGKQSTTITTAGIIMAIAFSSLLLSDTYVLNQFGFVLVAASLVDTFIVRTLFVPALMFLAVDSNWWPGKMPPAVRTAVFEAEGGSDADSSSLSDRVSIHGAEMSSPVHSGRGQQSSGAAPRLGSASEDGDVEMTFGGGAGGSSGGHLQVQRVRVKDKGVKLRAGAGRFAPVVAWAGVGTPPSGFETTPRVGVWRAAELQVGSQLRVLERLENVAGGNGRKRATWLKVRSADDIVGFLTEDAVVPVK